MNDDPQMEPAVSSLPSDAPDASEGNVGEGGKTACESDAKTLVVINDHGRRRDSEGLCAADILVNTSDRYVSEGVLGYGAVGIVRACRDPNLGRRVAVKTLHSKLAENSSLRERFVREGRVMSQLEHPNIVPVHEIGVAADGTVYFSMKLVQGESLEQVINHLIDADPAYVERYGRNRLLSIFVSLCNGVAFAHSQDVLHRDLKPDNVMIGEFGEVQIMDWGLVKVLNRDPDDAEAGGGDTTWLKYHDATATLEGQVAGTPLYMSPEQASGSIGDLDARSDLYSLGAILYRLLTLETYVEGEQIDEILEKVKTVSPIPPHKRSPKRPIPAELSAICMKALAKRKVDRYGSVMDMARDIERFRSGLTVSALREGALARFWKFMRRHPVWTVSVGVAACVLLVAALGLWAWRYNRFQTNLAMARTHRAQGEAFFQEAVAYATALAQLRQGLIVRDQTEDEQRLTAKLEETRYRGELHHRLATMLYVQAGNLTLLGSRDRVSDIDSPASLNWPDDPSWHLRGIIQEMVDLTHDRVELALVMGDDDECRRQLGFLEPLTKHSDEWLLPESRTWLASLRERVQGVSWLSISSRPAGVEVMLRPGLGDQADPDLPGAWRSLGKTPITDVVVRHGSWLVELRPTGRRPTFAMPLGVERAQRLALNVDVPERIPEGTVYIPGGDALLGGEHSSLYRLHRETLGPFFLKQTEVTFGEYLEFWKDVDDEELRDACVAFVKLDSDALCSRPAWDGNGELIPLFEMDHPVVGVTHSAASQYCEWLSRRLGRRYLARLPTAGEWEKAARGVDGRIFVWGNRYREDVANTGDNASARAAFPFAAPVMAFPVDRTVYGVFDMAGNVREWTGSPFADQTVGFQVKGGSFSTPRQLMYCSYVGEASSRSSDLGFRYVVLDRELQLSEDGRQSE